MLLFFILSISYLHSENYFTNGTEKWILTGSSHFSGTNILLTAPGKSQRGIAWKSTHNSLQEWEATFSVSVNCKSGNGNNGFGFWYAPITDTVGTVFGNVDNWNGLGVFFGCYPTAHRQNHPHLSVIVNDGTQSYDVSSDGASQTIGGAHLSFTCITPPPRFHIKVVFKQHQLWVLTSLPFVTPSQQSSTFPPISAADIKWNTVCYVKDVYLHTNLNFGFSASSDSSEVYIIHELSVTAPSTNLPTAPQDFSADSAAGAAAPTTKQRLRKCADPSLLSLSEPLQALLAEIDSLGRQISSLDASIQSKSAEANPDFFLQSTTPFMLNLNKKDRRRSFFKSNTRVTQDSDVATSSEFTTAMNRIQTATVTQYQQHKGKVAAKTNSVVDHALKGVEASLASQKSPSSTQLNTAITAFQTKQNSELIRYEALLNRTAKYHHDLEALIQSLLSQQKQKNTKITILSSISQALSTLVPKEKLYLQRKKSEINDHILTSLEKSWKGVSDALDRIFASGKDEILYGATEINAQHRNSKQIVTTSIQNSISETNNAISWSFLKIIFFTEVFCGIVLLFFASIRRKEA